MNVTEQEGGDVNKNSNIDLRRQITIVSINVCGLGLLNPKYDLVR